MSGKLRKFPLFLLCFLLIDNVRANESLDGKKKVNSVVTTPLKSTPKPLGPTKPLTIGPKPTAIVKEPIQNECCPQPIPICCPKTICYKPIITQPRVCCPKPVCYRPPVISSVCYPRCQPCRPAPCCLPTICYRARPICVKPIYCRQKPTCCPKVRCCRPKPPCCPRPLPPCPKPACIPPVPVRDFLPLACPCPVKPENGIKPLAVEKQKKVKSITPASRSLATREITQAELQSKN